MLLINRKLDLTHFPDGSLLKLAAYGKARNTMHENDSELFP